MKPWITIVGLGLALAGCTGQTMVSPKDDSAEAHCRAVFDTVAREVNAEAVADAEATNIPGYPFLRADRFLASFAGLDMGRDGLVAWIDRLRDLGLKGTRVEIGNLDPASRKRLDERTTALTKFGATEAIDRCAELLIAELHADPKALQKLRSAIDVPDDYDDLQRLVGVYPLSALPVALGYDRWRQANLGTFTMQPAALPTSGERVAYAPQRGAGALPPTDVRGILERSRANALRIPDPALADAARLIEAFAPIWLVDTVGPDDRIGAMAWDQNDTLTVEAERPVVYHKLTWTRFGRDILLQLNYLAWFPARAKQGSFDILAGPLDAVVWRVTLGMDGRPLIYDTMHACGCYHLFFPVPPLVAKPGPSRGDIRERAETPARGPHLAPGDRVAVWLAGVSHYVQTLSSISASGIENTQPVRYGFLAADELRNLDKPDGGTRSIYRPDGIVDGTERLERFLLWPMGIASPGAMRQWGTHATAFVGHRHFDDPWLFEETFELPRAGRNF